MSNKLDSNNYWNLVLSVLKTAMGFAYIVLGSAVIYKNWFLYIDLDRWAIWALGILLIAYGLYRIFRTFRNK